MVIPTCASEITLEWISKVLDIKIIPESFKLTQNVHEGIGFMSNMAKVQFQSEPNGEVQAIVIKLLPEKEEFKELALVDKYDQIEIKTYQTLLPSLIKILPELEENICPVLYTEIQEETSEYPYASVIVMKDLSPEGYFMKSYELNFGHPDEPNSYFCQGLDFLARLHAASDGLQAKYGAKLPDIDGWLRPYLMPGDDGRIPQFHSWVAAGFPAVYKIFEENMETPNPEMVELFKALEPVAPKSFLKVVEAGASSIYATAIHGDFWPNNALVREGDNSETNLKAIDWQLAGYTDPCLDLAMYIISSLDVPDLNKKNILIASKLYYTKYAYLVREKLGMTPRRSYKELEQFFTTYGLGYTLLWLVEACPFLGKFPAYTAKLYKSFEVLTEFGIPEFLITCGV